MGLCRNREAGVRGAGTTASEQWDAWHPSRRPGTVSRTETSNAREGPVEGEEVVTTEMMSKADGGWSRYKKGGLRSLCPLFLFPAASESVLPRFPRYLASVASRWSSCIPLRPRWPTNERSKHYQPGALAIVRLTNQSAESRGEMAMAFATDRRSGESRPLTPDCQASFRR